MYQYMTVDSINPCIRKVGLEQKKSHIGPRRFIYDYEMIYVEEGEFTVIYPEGDMTCHNGEIPLAWNRYDPRKHRRMHGIYRPVPPGPLLQEI